MKEQEEEEELSQKNLIRTPFLDKGLPYSSAARLELLTLLFFFQRFYFDVSEVIVVRTSC